MATPHVSGLAGLLFSVDPTLNAQDVRALIENNSDKISGTGLYWKKGRINVYKSIVAAGVVLGTEATPDLVASPSPTLEPILTPTPSPIITAISKPWWCAIWCP